MHKVMVIIFIKILQRSRTDMVCVCVCVCVRVYERVIYGVLAVAQGLVASLCSGLKNTVATAVA